ncbi:MAG: transcriptional regulator, partial [Pygmaiobacter sp.]
KNATSMFSIPGKVYGGYALAEMCRAEANAAALLAGQDVGLGDAVKDTSGLAMTTEGLSRTYPLYATSLFNLIKASETRMTGDAK